MRRIDAVPPWLKCNYALQTGKLDSRDAITRARRKRSRKMLRFIKFTEFPRG